MLAALHTGALNLIPVARPPRADDGGRPSLFYSTRAPEGSDSIALPPLPDYVPEPYEVARYERCAHGLMYRLVCPHWTTTCYFETSQGTMYATEAEASAWCRTGGESSIVVE